MGQLSIEINCYDLMSFSPWSYFRHIHNWAMSTSVTRWRGGWMAQLPAECHDAVWPRSRREIFSLQPINRFIIKYIIHNSFTFGLFETRWFSVNVDLSITYGPSSHFVDLKAVKKVHKRFNVNGHVLKFEKKNRVHTCLVRNLWM